MGENPFNGTSMSAAVTRGHLKTALGPYTMMGLVLSPCYTALMLFGPEDLRWPWTVLFMIIIASWLLLIWYFAIKDPDRLQTETFQSHMRRLDLEATRELGRDGNLIEGKGSEINQAAATYQQTPPESGGINER